MKIYKVDWYPGTPMGSRFKLFISEEKAKAFVAMLQEASYLVGYSPKGHILALTVSVDEVEAVE